MGNRLYVGNLSYQTTEDDLRQLFTGAGQVASVSIITERETGRSKGFAFVEMNSDQDANRAQSMFNGHSLHDRALKVDIARPREERPAGTGTGGGGFGDRAARGERGGDRGGGRSRRGGGGARRY